MRLYDTRLKAVVPIEPVTPGLLRMYACGPTVYRDAHVGNMRTFVLTDLIRRVAELEGLSVLLVQNITDVGHMVDDTGLGAAESGANLGAIDDGDVDEGQAGAEDKVLQQATAEGRSALDIARDYEARFHRDLAALNVRPAQHYPRASESIDLMVDLIAQLMERGHAYVGGDGSVFFDARSFPSYGELSGNRLGDLRPGHRFDGGVDPAKRFHADWALWKRAQDTRTQLVWDTPWGDGFPGWHTECSAMSLSLLGTSIDVHTGGIDLRFPHHEDERAQSNSASETEVVRHWVHGEHLLFEGRKMSKSSGNVVLVSDLIDKGLDPLALRLAFLQHRYRQQMNLTWDTLTAADSTLARWRQRVAEWATAPSAAIPKDRIAPILAVLSDDLDTPRAITMLRELEKDTDIAPGALFELFAYVDQVLGLDLVRQVGQPVAPVEPLPDAVAALLEQRQRARADKDWAASDALRDAMAALGWTVVDTSNGQEAHRS
jgi:cysteinyl-tRNA synthetase